MAKRKCPHKKVTRGKEMHIPVGTSYRHWFHDPEPIVEVRICDACGEWLSIGKAVDRKPEVRVEIRAAEVGQHAEVWRRFMDYDSLVDDDLVRIGAHTWVLSLGSLSPDAGHTCLYPLPRWTPGETIDYWAGWLAREIAEHDELQADADVLPPVSRGHENEGRCEGCREPIRDGEDVLRYDDDVVAHAHCPDILDDASDHLDGCTTDVCAPGCVTDPAAKFGEQARQATIALPGRVPYAEDQMELPVVDAMYPRGAAPDEIDRAVDEPLTAAERAEVYRILSDVPSDEPETETP